MSCKRAVADVRAELAAVVEAYAHPTTEGLARSYHPRVIHYVPATRTFARGIGELRRQLLAPIVATYRSAQLDVSALRLQYFHPDVVVAYGYISATAELRGGGTVTLPPSPETTVWLRAPDPHGPGRRYRIASSHTGSYDGDAVPQQPVRACEDDPRPNRCERVVAGVRTSLGTFNAAFDPPDIDSAARVFDEDVIQYVSASNVYYRGRQALYEGFFVPFGAVIARARIDFSVISFRVIGPLAIHYGAAPGEGEFKDGSPFVQLPLPQTVAYMRNPERDPQRPWVTVAAHE